MGLLDRFRRSAPSPAPPRRTLAVVLLSDERPVDMPAVLAYLRARGINSPGVDSPRVQPTLTSASIPGGQVEVESVPGQVPGEYLKGPVMVATWHWPTAAAEVPTHRSHLIVRAASTTLDAVDLRLLHSKWVAAVAAVTNAIGVYVGEAMLVRAAEAYVAEALSGSRAAVPVMLWVGFNPVNDDGTFSAYTTGLSAFGLRELEVHKNKSSGRFGPRHHGRRGELRTADGAGVGGWPDLRVHRSRADRRALRPLGVPARRDRSASGPVAAGGLTSVGTDERAEDARCARSCWIRSQLNSSR